jgi:hypothetical protein
MQSSCYIYILCSIQIHIHIGTSSHENHVTHYHHTMITFPLFLIVFLLMPKGLQPHRSYIGAVDEILTQLVLRYLVPM